MTRGGTRRAAGAIGLALAGMLLAGCGGGSKSTGSTTSGSAATAADFDFGANSPRKASAMGDSITRGVIDERGTVTRNNYPNNLQAMLRGQDPEWRVVNRGVSGETSREGAGRFGGVLGADRPGFALIMEGTNDATREDDPGFIVANLQSMVDQARGNRTVPVLATIPPNFRHDPGAQAIIDSANAMIRTLAQSQRVVLADVFSGMNDPNLFGAGPGVNVDPLHPNERGYQVMASIWFTALQQAVPRGAPAPTTASSAPPATPGGSVGAARTVKRK